MKELFNLFLGICLLIIIIFCLPLIFKLIPQHTYKVCSLKEGSLASSTDCATGYLDFSGGACVTVWPENTNIEIFFCKGVWINKIK